MSLGGDRPNDNVEGIADAVGEVLAVRMFFDRLASEIKKLPKALHGAFLDAILIGQILGGDARAELGEELVGGGLVGCRGGFTVKSGERVVSNAA